MHELPVTEQILRIVLDRAREVRAAKVLRINLVIGELTGFASESVQFYFDMLSKETEAKNASLSISRVPAKARCLECRGEFNPEGMNWFCPACSGPIGEILGGREFFVESIEVE